MNKDNALDAPMVALCVMIRCVPSVSRWLETPHCILMISVIVFRDVELSTFRMIGSIHVVSALRDVRSVLQLTIANGVQEDIKMPTMEPDVNHVVSTSVKNVLTMCVLSV
jgi:hypothetical protein